MIAIDSNVSYINMCSFIFSSSACVLVCVRAARVASFSLLACFVSACALAFVGKPVPTRDERLDSRQA